MNYFIKFIPQDGDLQIGDKIVSGNIALKEGWNWGFHDIETPEDLKHFTELKQLMERATSVMTRVSTVMTKKVKPFLCSMDIKEGDTAYDLEQPLSEFYVDKKRLHQIQNDEDFKGMKPYKILGEVSPAATWIKNGDKFVFGEVKMLIKHDSEPLTYFDDVPSILITHFLLKGPDGQFY